MEGVCSVTLAGVSLSYWDILVVHRQSRAREAWKCLAFVPKSLEVLEVCLSLLAAFLFARVNSQQLYHALKKDIIIYLFLISIYLC